MKTLGGWLQPRQRGDCVQVVVALVVTPEGCRWPMRCSRQHRDKTTLRGMVKTIQSRFGKAERIWVMDRGHAACGMTPIMPHAGLCRTSMINALSEHSWMRHNSEPPHRLAGS